MRKTLIAASWAILLLFGTDDAPAEYLSSRF
jgi:hypothetical protein